MTRVVANVVVSEEGQCWRRVMDPNPARLGRPTICPNVVRWIGWSRQATGKRVRVWSCDEHLEGVEGAHLWVRDEGP